MEGIIRAICTSEKRGTEKKQTEMAEFVKNYGISGDAHAGNWHRQVSLLSYEKTEEFNRKGADVKAGDFGENLLVEGIDFRRLERSAITTVESISAWENVSCRNRACLQK